MAYIFLVLGLSLAVYDMSFYAKSMLQNIARKTSFIIAGIALIYFMDRSYLSLNMNAVLFGSAIGILFLVLHLIISGGVKLKFAEVSRGLIKTSILMYVIELPAEEFLYRGIILVSAIVIFNPVISITLSSLLFLLLHLKTWDNKFVWFGSLLLAVTCGVVTYITKSIWAAVIIHNLNDLGFMTLVNKRDVFTNRNKTAKL